MCWGSNSPASYASVSLTGNDKDQCSRRQGNQNTIRQQKGYHFVTLLKNLQIATNQGRLIELPKSVF